MLYYHKIIICKLDNSMRNGIILQTKFLEIFSHLKECKQEGLNIGGNNFYLIFFKKLEGNILHIIG